MINIAIEGQLLLGAFTAAIVASGTGSLWLGLVSGALAGSLVGALLAVFAIGYRVDQVVLGVVLNTLILGLTGYLYDDAHGALRQHAELPGHVLRDQDPAAGRHPDHRPGVLRLDVFLYLTYIALAGVQVGPVLAPGGGCAPGPSASTRWRPTPWASGCIAMRYRNVIVAGLIAGIGGAYFTIGSVGSFGKDMSSGEGYIALAAMIFGRYTPFGAIVGGAAVRLHHAAAVDPVHAQHADPVEPAAA